MTAAELNAFGAPASEATALVEGITEQAILRGIVATAEAFDYNAPLPDLHIRQRRPWEAA